MNKRLIPIIILAIAVVLFIYTKPLALVKHKEISRGYELIKGIEAYQQKKRKLPENGDWSVFQEIGFTLNELERADPEFRKLSDTSFELSYTEGFDPPYLSWKTMESKVSIAIGCSAPIALDRQAEHALFHLLCTVICRTFEGA